ncbi:MAG TPA: ISAs1 family transposase [Actinomycetes bacterium]
MTPLETVPAPTSSPIPTAAKRLDAPVALAPDQCRSLLDELAQITDPRQRRGRRHMLGVVLAVAVAAVLAGARSLAAIGEWAADAPGPVLAALGVHRHPLRRVWRPPGEATVRRVLACVDADALDLVIARWLADQQLPQPRAAWRQAVAVDGKTLRGSGHHGHPQVHLLAAMDHTTRAVLGQTDVDSKTNEIARFRPLLDGLDLAGRVITADAIHTQREHADWLVTQKHAAYLLVVKGNQPTLHQQLKALPWRAIPIADHTRNRGHGRVELRRVQVTTVAGLDFPHATQALRITRRVGSLHSQRWRTVTVYAVTSLTAAQAHPARLADYLRGHWGIEAFTTSATPPSPRTPPRSVPATPHKPWPAYATSPSPSCASAATATSPPRCAATPATPPESCHCSASPARESDIPALAEALPFAILLVVSSILVRL